MTLLAETGWNAYVDWADTRMPDTPNRETANRLRQKIVELDYFLYLATSNSGMSRWCPWEIGYADGTKPIDRIIVCPTSDGGLTNGSEYLDLYRRLDLSSLNNWLSGNREIQRLVCWCRACDENAKTFEYDLALLGRPSDDKATELEGPIWS